MTGWVNYWCSCRPYRRKVAVTDLALQHISYKELTMKYLVSLVLLAVVLLMVVACTGCQDSGGYQPPSIVSQ